MPVGTDDLPFLERWAGRSTQQLLELEGRYRTDSIVGAFEQALDAKAAASGDDALADPERVVLDVEALEREVNSGGFDGLFRWAPDRVPTLATSLEMIGRGDAAALAGEAIRAIGLTPPVTEDAIRAARRVDDDGTTAGDDALDALDQRYYESIGDLSEDLLAYIQANSDQITLPAGALAGSEPGRRPSLLDRLRGMLGR
jgi:hypothetical protein